MVKIKISSPFLGDVSNTPKRDTNREPLRLWESHQTFPFPPNLGPELIHAIEVQFLGNVQL